MKGIEVIGKLTHTMPIYLNSVNEFMDEGEVKANLEVTELQDNT